MPKVGISDVIGELNIQILHFGWKKTYALMSRLIPSDYVYFQDCS